MSKIVDLSGEKFGRLTVTSMYTVGPGKKHWSCICDCGETTVVASTHLIGGKTSSCGCLRRDLLRNSRTKHGFSETKTYATWCRMRDRCLNQNNPKFQRYGGRGISVCSRWDVFDNFLFDMGEKPERMSIGRIDNDGNYTPENCRWESDTQQSRNKSTTRNITHNGCTKTMTDWATLFDIPVATLFNRLEKGISMSEALKPKPVRKMSSKESV